MTDTDRLAALIAESLRATARRYGMRPGVDAIDYFPDAEMWAVRIAAHLDNHGVTLAPTPPDALDPHRGETAWTRGHGQGDWCRVHGVIDEHTSVKQHILDQHPDIDYDQHLETAIANSAPTPPDALLTDEAVLDWLYERGDDKRMADAYQLVAAALAQPKKADR